MNIIVCVKQVPDTTEIKIDPETNTLMRDGVESILNPYDHFAVEEAVRLRGSPEEGKVIVLSMGPPQARSALMKCLALGADEAYLLSDRAFAGADTWATSNTLARAIGNLEFDLILCGQQAIDGDTAQVGPEIAQLLGVPQVTYVEKIEVVEGRRLNIHKQTEEGYQVVETKLPALLALMPPTSFQPGSPKMSGILKAKKKPYTEWSAEDLGGDASKYGLDGSPTQVIRTYGPPKREKGVIFDDEPGTSAKKLAAHLFDDGILKKGE